jgi:hypothetical protein
MIILELRGYDIDEMIKSIGKACRIIGNPSIRGKAGKDISTISFTCEYNDDLRLFINVYQNRKTIFTQLFLDSAFDEDIYVTEMVREFITSNIDAIKAMLRGLKDALNPVLGMASPYPHAMFMLDLDNTLPDKLWQLSISGGDICPVVNAVLLIDKPSILAHQMIMAIESPLSLLLTSELPIDLPDLARCIEDKPNCGFESARDLVNALEKHGCIIAYEDDLAIIKSRAQHN